MATIQVQVSDAFAEMMREQRGHTNETVKAFVLRTILRDLVERGAFTGEEAKHWYCYEMKLPYTPPAPKQPEADPPTLQ